VAEEVAGPLDRAEQVRDHWEPTALDVGIQDGRSSAGIDAALDLSCFQARIDLVVQAHEVAGAVEVIEQ
jgi:hypothetical protein